MSASIFPLHKLMLICQCRNERQVPQQELDTIQSVADLKRFTDRRIMLYACRCGAKKCDIRMLPNEAAMAELAAADTTPSGRRSG